MKVPHAYPELILASAQDKIRALEHQEAREDARQAARRASRKSRRGAWSWWRRRGTRPPQPGD
jgi:hypothetical protein